MSKQIDPNNITTVDDRRYLLSRPWMVDEFRRQGYGDQMDAVENGQEVRPSPEDETRVTTDDMRVGTQVPQQIDPRGNGVLDGDEDEVDDNYEEWTKAELESEVDARNAEEDRETKLSKSGNKDELAKRLHEDDAAQVASA